jgi:hypothetical protein
MWNRYICVHMIDFPGLEKVYYRDQKALKNIANSLSNTYANNMRLSGILYLHPITRPKLEARDHLSVQILKTLCGWQSLQAVTLVITSWEQIDEATGSHREEGLTENYTLLANMLPSGRCTARYFGNRKSAMAVVDSIVERQETLVLNFQKQFVDKGLNLDETAVGLLVTESARKPGRI